MSSIEKPQFITSDNYPPTVLAKALQLDHRIRMNQSLWQAVNNDKSGNLVAVIRREGGVTETVFPLTARQMWRLEEMALVLVQDMTELGHGELAHEICQKFRSESAITESETATVKSLLEWEHPYKKETGKDI